MLKFWIQNVLQEVKSVIWLRSGASDNFVRLLPGPIFIWLRASLRASLSIVYIGRQVIRQSIMHLFPVAGVHPRIYFPWQVGRPPADTIFFLNEVERSIMMKKWLQTAKPDDRGESLRALQEVSKERITSVANQYFTNLWGVGGSQGRGAPSIEYRDRQKAKEQCVKIFVEKYDTVTAPSGEGQAVRKQMTVQVEEWWNSSDVAASLREENAWGADGTVAVVGKFMT